jgi:hypothetical protein
MSRSLTVFSACVLFAAGAIAISAKAKKESGRWPEGYSANFITTNTLDPTKNCNGRLYVNALREPRGVRRDFTCEGKVHTTIWLQQGGTFVLDPEKKVFWKPRVLAHLEANTSASGRNYVGREKLNGRFVERYEQRSDLSGKSEVTVWEDSRLRTAVRVISTTTTFELSGIEEGRQPKSLFVVPDGYHEVAPPSGE